jgi:hypothetical protein
MLIINYFLKKVQGSDLPFPEDETHEGDVANKCHFAEQKPERVAQRKAERYYG